MFRIPSESPDATIAMAICANPAVHVSGDSVQSREVIGSTLLGLPRTNVLWITEEPSRVPAGCAVIDPVDAYDEGILDELDDSITADQTAVVIDIDGLNPFDASDRFHMVGQAQKAHRYVRITA